MVETLQLTLSLVKITFVQSVTNQDSICPFFDVFESTGQDFDPHFASPNDDIEMQDETKND